MLCIAHYSRWLPKIASQSIMDIIQKVVTVEWTRSFLTKTLALQLDLACYMNKKLYALNLKNLNDVKSMPSNV